MKGLMKAAMKGPETGNPYLSNPMEGVEKQKENLEVSGDDVEEAMKPALTERSEGEGDMDTHDASEATSQFRTFTSKQTEMGEIG